MPMNEILVDSSFLYALYSNEDRFHDKAINFSQISAMRPIIPDVVLPEVTFLFSRNGGIFHVIEFLTKFVKEGIETIPLKLADIERAHKIMNKYASAELDFVVCAIVALAERLNITQVLTFDRRDFRIVRPEHVSVLDILP